MKIKKFWSLIGANIYSKHKVAIFLFNAGFTYSNKFNQNKKRALKILFSSLPDLKKFAYYTYSDGNLRKKAKINLSISLPELVMAVTVALLNQVLTTGKMNVVHQAKDESGSEKYLVIECINNKPLRRTYYYAMREAIKVIRRVLNHKDLKIKESVRNLKSIYHKERLTLKANLIIKEAQKRKIPYIFISGKNVFQLGLGEKQVRLNSSDVNDSVSRLIADRKNVFKDLFRSIGSVVPPGDRVRSRQEAVDLAERIGYPVVIKPCAGSYGEHVYVNIKNRKDLIKAFDVTFAHNYGVLLEKFISGRDYRLTLIDNKLVAGTERIPARVFGDGRHTVRQLINIENEQNPNRSYKTTNTLQPIKTDAYTIKVLKRQGLNYRSIPKKGQEVFIRETANVSNGGESVDITDQVHPKTKNILSYVSRVAGLKIAGIDLLCPDISKELKDGEWTIIEVNARPGINIHHMPHRGKKRNIAGMMLDMLFPKKDARIPIFSVTGTNGKTTTTRMIAHILSSQNKKIGLSVTGSLSVGQEEIFSAGSGPYGARSLLLDPSVQAGVFEITHKGIINTGLFYDYSDVGVITNVDDDHINPVDPAMNYPDIISGVKDLYKVKSVVAENVKKGGVLVLNADDKLCVRMSKVALADVVFYSMDFNNKVIKEHIKRGGEAYYVDKNSIYRNDSGKITKIMAIKDIPATQQGKIRHNIQNALAVIAAVLSQSDIKVDIKTVRSALSKFKSSTDDNPGRMNLIKFSGFNVMLDYAHNLGGYRSAINAIKEMPAKRKVAVIKAAGNRPDKVIKKIGEMAGKYFDKIYIKDPSAKKIKSRSKGEVAQLLKQGVMAAGMNEENIEVVLDEKTCIKKALADSQPGDLLSIFGHDIRLISQIIKDKLNNIN